MTSHRTIRKAVVAAFALAFLSPSPSRAQSQRADSVLGHPRVTRILGVYDDLGIVAHAEVFDLLSCSRSRDSTGVLSVDLKTCARTITSPTGNASLWWVLALRDTALIRIRKMGYADTSLALSVGPADTASVLVVLRRIVAATSLPTVTVVESMQLRRFPRLRDFFERQHRGIGHFLGPDLLRAMEQKGFVDVDAALTAIGASDRRTQTFHGACKMALFVNGLRVFSVPFSEPLQLKDFDAIEFYKGPAEAPAVFNHPCGSIVYWTRSR